MPTREDRIASLSRLLQEERRTTYNLRAALRLEQVRCEKMEMLAAELVRFIQEQNKGGSGSCHE